MSCVSWCAYEDNLGYIIRLFDSYEQGVLLSHRSVFRKLKKSHPDTLVFLWCCSGETDILIALGIVTIISSLVVLNDAGACTLLCGS